MSRLFHSLVATSIVAGSAAGMSAVVRNYVPKGEWRDRADRYLVAPGAMVYERVQEQKGVRRLEEEGQDRLKAEEKKVQKAADQVKDEVGRTTAGRKAVESVSEETEKLRHYYTIGTWAVAGFVLCFVMTVFLGISSIATAVSLGFKVTLTFIFLQGALVFGGLLALQKLHG